MQHWRCVVTRKDGQKHETFIRCGSPQDLATALTSKNLLNIGELPKDTKKMILTLVEEAA